MADGDSSGGRVASIPTEYKSILFRSRLEARWAAFFDAARWQWEYEPFDLPGWTPDFRVAFGRFACLVEVKPSGTLFDLRCDANKAFKVDGHNVLAVGLAPLLCDVELYNHDGDENCGYGRIASGFKIGGILYDFDHHSKLRSLEAECDFAVVAEIDVVDDAVMLRCASCRRITVVHAHSSFHCRACGHHKNCPDGSQEPVATAWAYACNQTQWKGRR